MGAKHSSKLKQQQTTKQQQQPKTTTTTTTTNTSNTSHNNGGISLKFIIELSQQLSENDTMEDFVRQIIKPATKDKQESYFQLLTREQPSKIKSTADHFISHVWSYKTKSDLLASLKYTLLDKTKTDDDIFIWLDALCVNQHQISSIATPEQLQQTFGESLKKIGSVIIVLSNWQNPSYATRIWCVFEAYMTQKIPNVKVILAMSQQEEESLMNAMIENDVGIRFLQTLFGTVDVERATAREFADQQAILHLIQKFGVADVNSVILNNLKQWIIQVGDIALQKWDENSLQAGRVCFAMFSVYSVLKDIMEALQWSKKGLDIYIQVFGSTEHMEVATAYTNYSNALKEAQQFDQALEMNNQAISIYIKTIGEDHPYTITARSRTAAILEHQGKLEEAIRVFDQVIPSRLRVSGENDIDTAAVLNRKGECLRRLKRLDEALPLFQQAVTITRNVLGNSHPELGGSLCSLGACLDGLHRHEEALIVYDECLSIMTKSYGNDDVNVAMFSTWKALCLKHLGRKEEARMVGKHALDILERKLGYDHPNTVATRKNWGG
jgi:tetratricopeptide (TPR) repeat protein